MPFYLVHEGKRYRVHIEVGYEPEIGKKENVLTKVCMEEINHSPQWESMEPSDEEFEP